VAHSLVVPNVTLVTAVLGVPVLVATVAVGTVQRQHTGRWRADPADLARRKNWVTPSDVLTRQLPRSTGRNLVLGTMRIYLVVAIVLLVVSIAQLAR